MICRLPWSLVANKICYCLARAFLITGKGTSRKSWAADEGIQVLIVVA